MFACFFVVIFLFACLFVCLFSVLWTVKSPIFFSQKNVAPSCSIVEPPSWRGQNYSQYRGGERAGNSLAYRELQFINPQRL